MEGRDVLIAEVPMSTSISNTFNLVIGSRHGSETHAMRLTILARCMMIRASPKPTMFHDKGVVTFAFLRWCNIRHFKLILWDHINHMQQQMSLRQLHWFKLKLFSSVKTWVVVANWFPHAPQDNANAIQTSPCLRDYPFLIKSTVDNQWTPGSEWCEAVRNWLKRSCDENESFVFPRAQDQIAILGDQTAMEAQLARKSWR